MEILPIAGNSLLSNEIYRLVAGRAGKVVDIESEGRIHQKDHLE